MITTMDKTTKISDRRRLTCEELGGDDCHVLNAL